MKRNMLRIALCFALILGLTGSALAETTFDGTVVSGESGAVTTGIVQWLMQHPAATAQRAALGLGPDSSVLLISTEGDTAPDVYKNVVWFGAYPDLDLP